MSNNNSQIFLRNFGDFEITKYFDPQSLKDMEIPVQSTKAEFEVTNHDVLVTCKTPSVVEDTTFKLNASILKNDNDAVFRALSEAGRDLGAATFSSGNLSREYSQVVVSSPIKNMGNNATFTSVSVKFQR